MASGGFHVTNLPILTSLALGGCGPGGTLTLFADTPPIGSTTEPPPPPLTTGDPTEPPITTDDTDVPVLPPPWIDDPTYDDVMFAVDVLHRVELTFDPTSWELLATDGSDWSEGLVTIDGIAFDHVGVRLTGDDRGLGWQGKSPLELGFDAFLDGAEFGGLETLRLSNQASDPTTIRQVLAHEFLATSGLPTPRASFVELVIDGESRGLYTAVEPVDKVFVGRHNPNPEADLWEGQDGGDFTVSGRSQIALVRGEGLSTARVDALVDSVATSGDDFWARTDADIDMTAFTRLWAWLAMTGHLEAYPYETGDFFLISDASRGDRFLPVAWDVDEGWVPEALYNAAQGQLGVRCVYDPTCNAALLAQVAEAATTWDAYGATARAEAAISLVDPVTDVDDNRSYTPQEVQAARVALLSQLSTWSQRVRLQAGL